jgi:DMSO/TMAO reductase YedYZ heme-binding membrane subunit
MNWIIIMRIIATIWILFVSGTYPLLEYIWGIGKTDGTIDVPLDVCITLHYWQASVGLMLTLFLTLMYLSIKQGRYGNNRDS